MKNIYVLPLEERRQRFEEIVASLSTNDPAVEYLCRWATPEESKGVSDFVESISEPVGCPFCLDPENNTIVEESQVYNYAEWQIFRDFYEDKICLKCDDGSVSHLFSIDYCPKCGRRLKND